MRLEPELWDALSEICEREMLDMSTLVRQVEAAGHIGGRTSAVRVYIQNYFRAAATEIGHAAAGHGPMPRSRVAEMPRPPPDHNPQHQTALIEVGMMP